MSFNLIAFVVFLGSFFGAAAILVRKMPLLSQLPEVKYQKHEWRNFLDARIKYLIERAGKIHYEVILQKILSRICVLTLKAEHKVNQWLQRLREKEKSKKIVQNDHYWDKFKETVSRKRVRTPR